MSNEPAGALAGVRVVDLSDRLSGAFCARLFADQGADVVMVEPPQGHPIRHEPPFLDDASGLERSLLHTYASAGKRSVVLAGDASELRDALIEVADVVVVTSCNDAQDATASARDTSTIVSVTPYGTDTAWADAPGTDLTTAAATGWAAVNGDPGAPPLRPTLHQSLYLAGVIAYTGAVAALAAGGGEFIDVCEMEPMLWMAAPGILAGPTGDPFARNGARAGVFSGPVPAADGYVSVTFSRPHFWVEAMHALGLDDLAEDPRYQQREVRMAEADSLQATIEAAIAKRDRWELFHELSARRCTVGLVLDMRDLAESEHLAERGVIGQTTIEGRSVAMLESPSRMSETPWRMRRPAPRLGEHTDEVLSEWIGPLGSEAPA